MKTNRQKRLEAIEHAKKTIFAEFIGNPLFSLPSMGKRRAKKWKKVIKAILILTLLFLTLFGYSQDTLKLSKKDSIYFTRTERMHKNINKTLEDNKEFKIFTVSLFIAGIIYFVNKQK